MLSKKPLNFSPATNKPLEPYAPASLLQSLPANHQVPFFQAYLEGAASTLTNRVVRLSVPNRFGPRIVFSPYERVVPHIAGGAGATQRTCEIVARGVTTNSKSKLRPEGGWRDGKPTRAGRAELCVISWTARNPRHRCGLWESELASLRSINTILCERSGDKTGALAKRACGDEPGCLRRGQHPQAFTEAIQLIMPVCRVKFGGQDRMVSDFAEDFNRGESVDFHPHRNVGLLIRLSSRLV